MPTSKPTILKIQGDSFVILPLADYEALLSRPCGGGADGGGESASIPSEVAANVVHNEVSLARAWREYRRLTQADVAHRMGISQGTLARIETSARPRADTLRRLARALDLRIEQLVA